MFMFSVNLRELCCFPFRFGSIYILVFKRVQYDMTGVAHRCVYLNVYIIELCEPYVCVSAYVV